MKTIKITKRLREQAALVCDVEASTPDLYGESDAVAKLLGFPEKAGMLAFAAEAAQRLREGLVPPPAVWDDLRWEAA